MPDLLTPAPPAGKPKKLLEQTGQASKLSRGVKDVSTTMIYTHGLNKPGIGVRSPLD